MQHAEPLPNRFPWRTATFVVGGVAAVELVALLVLGAVRLAPDQRTHAKTAAPAAPKRAVVATPRVTAHPLRPRSRVRVLVLNGNGVSGAASAEAARLQAQGYRIGGATNAERHDYARSMVMFVPGWSKEAHRLARDAGIRMVAPVDGLHPSQLRGSGVVLLLGK